MNSTAMAVETIDTEFHTGIFHWKIYCVLSALVHVGLCGWFVGSTQLPVLTSLWLHWSHYVLSIRVEAEIVEWLYFNITDRKSVCNKKW